MALRAYIQSIEFPTDTDAHIVGVVTDDVRKQVVDLTVSSMAELKNRLGVVLQKVETLDELRSIQPNDIIDLTLVPPVVPPGQAFFVAWGVLQSELSKVEAGLLVADDKRVTDARVAALALDQADFLVGRR